MQPYQLLISVTNDHLGGELRLNLFPKTHTVGRTRVYVSIALLKNLSFFTVGTLHLKSRFIIGFSAALAKTKQNNS